MADEWMTSRRIDLDNPPEEARPYVELYERTKKELDLLKKDLAAKRPDITAKVAEEQIDVWCRTLFARAGVQVVRFGEGANGLLNVPGKYVLIIDAMHLAMVSLAEGEPLPEFTPVEPKKKRSKKTRRS